MARKKIEFRPDPTGSGLLSKLYITPSQRKVMGKWGLYGILCVAILVVQDVILGRVSLYGGTVDLVPCAIMLVCVLEGVESGCVFVLVAAIFYMYSGSAPGPYCVVLLTLNSVLVTVFRQNYLRRSFGSHWICTAAASLLYQMEVFLLGVFLTQTYLGRVGAFAMNALLGMCVLPVVYPVFVAIGKIGGQTWKE